MKPLRLVIVLSIAVIVGLHCSQPSQPKTDLSDQYSIYLTGRVLDKDGKPMANAVAKLAGRNLTDTTGADGYYYVTEKKAGGVAKTAAASLGDSLQILKAGQVITYLDIVKWIDTLPDVFIIQRDIYGSLSSAPASFSRITATITGDSIPDSLAEVAELGYIPATGNYSGFVYFVYTAQTLNYNVYVSVYNADSVLIGRSITVTFPSTAGDISMPAFDPNNAVPAPTLEIVQPIGGETYHAGDTATIQWKINDSSQNLNIVIDFSLDNGNHFTTLFGRSFPPETTSVLWIIDSSQVSNQCIIFIHDYFDYSIQDRSGIFSVLTSSPTNPGVVGTLFNPDGSPAVNTKVVCISSDYDPRDDSGLGIDSTTSDANGRYSINLSSGMYNMFASGSGNLVYQDSIMVITGSTVNLPADTLKVPGSIRGVVQLELGDDPRTVFILFLGTRTFTTPDDTAGNFTISNLAEGKYRVRILTTTPNYAAMDTSLIVIAGTQNVLSQPIVLQYTGIPPIINLDSLGRYNEPSTDGSQACLATKLLMYWRIFDSLEVAVLGSSQANWGINPTMITGLKAINMAAPLADPLTQKNIILCYLVKHTSRIKVVCSSLDIGWLANADGDISWKSGLGQSTGYKYDSCHAFWAGGVSSDFRTSIRQVPIPTTGDTVNIGFVGQGSLGWGANPPPINGSITWDTTDANYQHNFTTIAMLADTLRSRGVHWIVINFPVSPNYRTTAAYNGEGPSWSTAHAIIQQVRGIEVSNQYFHFYDANVDGNHDYTDQDAYDENHLSGQGAAKLSGRVDSLIHSIVP